VCEAQGHAPLPLHLATLLHLVQVSELGLEDRVRFVVSFTDSQRAALLAASTAVVYTPQVCVYLCVFVCARIVKR